MSTNFYIYLIAYINFPSYSTLRTETGHYSPCTLNKKGTDPKTNALFVRPYGVSARSVDAVDFDVVLLEVLLFDLLAADENGGQEQERKVDVAENGVAGGD